MRLEECNINTSPSVLGQLALVTDFATETVLGGLCKVCVMVFK